MIRFNLWRRGIGKENRDRDHLEYSNQAGLAAQFLLHWKANEKVRAIILARMGMGTLKEDGREGGEKGTKANGAREKRDTVMTTSSPGQ